MKICVEIERANVTCCSCDKADRVHTWAEEFKIAEVEQNDELWKSFLESCGAPAFPLLQ